MQAILKVVGGIHDGQQIPIRAAEFLIGRDSSCHLRPVSPSVSRQHCAIVQKSGRIFLRDYGSSNGTLLNDRMLLQGELQLEDGDTIKVGPLTFILSLQSEIADTAVGHQPAPEPSSEAFALGDSQEGEENIDDTRLEL